MERSIFKSNSELLSARESCVRVFRSSVKVRLIARSNVPSNVPSTVLSIGCSIGCPINCSVERSIGCSIGCSILRANSPQQGTTFRIGKRSNMPKTTQKWPVQRGKKKLFLAHSTVFRAEKWYLVGVSSPVRLNVRSDVHDQMFTIGCSIESSIGYSLQTVAIQSLSAGEQREVLLWIFTKEDRVWIGRGGAILP